MPRTPVLRRRRTSPDRRPLLLGALAVAIAAGGTLLSRRRGRAAGVEQPAPVVPGPPSEAPVAKSVEEAWSCACGQEYRVQGEDRHRVYWLADASVSDPVLAPVCPSCDRPLPGEHEQREATS